MTDKKRHVDHLFEGKASLLPQAVSCAHLAVIGGVDDHSIACLARRFQRNQDGTQVPVDVP